MTLAPILRGILVLLAIFGALVGLASVLTVCDTCGNLLFIGAADLHKCSRTREPRSPFLVLLVLCGASGLIGIAVGWVARGGCYAN